MRVFVVAATIFGLVLGAAALIAEEGHPPHWDYEGEAGPGHWADLSAEFETCASGVEQSPIDLTAAGTQDVGDLALDYQDAPLNIVNNGHTIQLDYAEGSSLTIGDNIYNLAQFHFHSPSEHTIDGQYFPLEMHLVHKDAENHLAVIGIMVEEQVADNPAFAVAWDHLPTIATERRTISALTFNVADFLPGNLSDYFRYQGSLTTPPCSEGVLWTVLREPVGLSASQIAAFRAVYEGNNRPVQPLNDRVLLEDTGD